MKWMLFTLILVVALCAGARGQSNNLYADSTSVGTTKDSIGFTTPVYHIVVSNDETSGSALLWYAWRNDTTAGRRFPIHQGETLSLPASGPGWCRFWSSSGTIHLRYLAY
jgi:hypothetical protein